MNGLRPDEMMTIKAMEEGDWRLLVWSELLAARGHRKIVLAVITTFGSTLAVVVLTQFVLWMLHGGLTSVAP